MNLAKGLCSVPPVPEREFANDVNLVRRELIQILDEKWVNGTTLHYYFFEDEPFGTSAAEKDVVRSAFQVWKDVGIGLEFEEVTDPVEAEIRIGFQKGDGSWSFLGRQVLQFKNINERTMNFGWDLTDDEDDIDTPIHEIGHTLGFPHEHQNPIAGIVWDADVVYAATALPPNNWDKDTTNRNILNKIPPDVVQGSSWDSDSIMHYPLGAGWILQPEEFKSGLVPESGLSNRDKSWVKAFYPPLTSDDYSELKPFESQKLAILPGQQRNFVINPPATREYNIQTFGDSDTVIVLFEDDNGHLRYIDGDDDSGEDFNSHLRIRLEANRKYVLRIRLYYSDREGEAAVMVF